MNFGNLPVIAVDPGLSGAVVRLDGLWLSVWRDFNTLRDLAEAVAGACATLRRWGPRPRLVIEFVHAMPGQGVTSMFTFGRSTGTAFGAMLTAGLSWPIYEVTPQKWQKWYREMFDIVIFDSREVAPKVLTPEMLDKCRKKRGSLDHNACDAALMAVWCANQPIESLKVSEHWETSDSAPRKKRSQPVPRLSEQTKSGLKS